MAATVDLSKKQIENLADLEKTERYPDAYRYLRDIANQAITASVAADQHQRLETFTMWLDRAASINANDGSFSSEFVRGVTKEFGALEKKPISDAAFQKASNNLAAAVIKKVITAGGIPTVEDIIQLDVSKAVVELNIDPWCWVGTVGDILPKSIGGLGQNFVAFPISDARGMGEAYAKIVAANNYDIGRWITSHLPDPFSSAIDLANLGGEYDYFGNFIRNSQTNLQHDEFMQSPLILDEEDIEVLRKTMERLAALVDLDFDHENKIENSTTGFSQLCLWKDVNGNAIDSDGKRHTVEAADDAGSISYSGKTKDKTDAKGKRHPLSERGNKKRCGE